MYRIIKNHRFISLIFFISFTFALQSCMYDAPRDNPYDYKNIGGEGSANVPITGVSLNKTTTTIAVGSTEQLIATIEPANATNQNVTWSSSDETKAVVTEGTDGGLVTALASGSAIITVTTEEGNFTATCTVTVSVKVIGVSLNKSTTSIDIGSVEQLMATIEPADATNKNVSWSTSDSGKAIVSANGLITALGMAGGSSTITVTTEDGGFTTSCVATINSAPIYSADGVSFYMAYVPGGITFPTGTDDSGTATVTNAFWIGETEVTYELWYTVHAWATSNEYSFANLGREGNDGTIGGLVTNQEPVTTINWRDAMVWCNALTEWYNAQEGTSYSCVYYTDSGYTTPIRSADDTDSVIYPDPGGQDDPYVNSGANGFRLLTSDEWRLAARWRNDDTNTVAGYSNPWFTQGDSASGAYTYYNDVTDVNPANGVVDGKDANDAVAVYYYYWDGDSWEVTGVSGTAEVKSKGIAGANTLGCSDMSGNAGEWCFDWSPNYVGTYRMIGGSTYYWNAQHLQIGSWSWMEPYGDLSNIGFRLARSE